MNFKKFLLESSLSRIYQYIEDDKSFAVISAFRGDKSVEENNKNHIELKKDVRNLGLGFIEMRGGYLEEEGFVNEKSLFIPGISKKNAIALGVKFNQRGILFKDKDGFFEIGTNKSSGIGNITAKFISGAGKKNMSMNPEIVREFFSSLMKGGHAGKKFVFSIQEKEDIGHLSRMSGKKPDWITIYKENIK